MNYLTNLIMDIIAKIKSLICPNPLLDMSMILCKLKIIMVSNPMLLLVNNSLLFNGTW